MGEKITVRAMSRMGQEPFVAAILIAKSQGLDTRDTMTILKVRDLENFLAQDNPQLSITIAWDGDNVPVGVAIRHRIDIFKDCQHAIENRLELFVPDGESEIFHQLTTAAQTQSYNEHVEVLRVGDERV